MFLENPLVVAIKCSYYFVSIFGMLPVKYNYKKFKFETSVLLTSYSLLILVAFSYTYLTSGVSVISSLNPLIAITFIYLSYSAICLTVMIQCLQRHKITRFLNRVQLFLHELKTVTNQYEVSYSQEIILILLKTVFINCLTQYAVISAVHSLLLQITGKRDYVAIFIMCVAYFMQTIISNLFYALILASAFYFKLINKKICRIIEGAQYAMNIAQHGSNFLKLNQYLECSDRLDELAIIHRKLTNLTRSLNSLCSVQLLISTINFVGILVIQVRNYL